MKRVFLSLLLVCAGFAAIAEDGLRFRAVDIYLDSPRPFAAWQFELNDLNGAMRVVGVENGESTAFARAPYYDREAVQLGTADRIIVADFTLADEAALPSGRVRIATLHLLMEGSAAPAFDLRLVTATTRNGEVIDATIDLEELTGTTR